MTPFAFLELSPGALLLLLIVGLVLFGRKLPEMGKYLGKGIVEFKKGMHGLEDDIESGPAMPRHSPSSLEAPRPPQRVGTSVPKFDDNPGAIQQAPAVQSAPTPPQSPEV